jgi:hypothetical protein
MEGTDMLQRARKYWLLLAVLLPVGGAPAAERCPSKPDNWTCFSEMELKDSTAKTRMFIYSNHELLAEIEQGATTKRYLVAQPSGIQLCSGLSKDESMPFGGKNPFQFLELSFAAPITALQTAFPAGPSSVPGGESRKNISLEGKPVSITTSRHGAGEIAFRLDFTGLHASGKWRMVALKPLPDTYSLVGWTNAQALQFPSLREARSAH